MPLTEEDDAKLRAPFPSNLIKSFTGKGGKEMRYIDVEEIEKRIASVDRNWGKDVQLGAKGVAVHYTILGTRRGDCFDNEEDAKYGGPQVNAYARACRRAARCFGVGAQLWEEDEETTQRPSRSSGSNNNGYNNNNRGGGGSQSGGKTGASEKQTSYLKDVFQVPESVSALLTPGREGTATALIAYLKDINTSTFKKNPLKYIEEGLAKVAPAAARGLEGVGSGGSRYDDDDDLD